MSLKPTRRQLVVPCLGLIHVPQMRQFYRGSFSTHLDLPHGLRVLRIPTRRSRSGLRGPNRSRALPQVKNPTNRPFQGPRRRRKY